QALGRKRVFSVLIYWQKQMNGCSRSSDYRAVLLHIAATPQTDSPVAVPAARVALYGIIGACNYANLHFS
ncbi:hypothetical protein LDENG_00154410, partial [Lucifuga dentata]